MVATSAPAPQAAVGSRARRPPLLDYPRLRTGTCTADRLDPEPGPRRPVSRYGPLAIGGLAIERSQRTLEDASSHRVGARFDTQLAKDEGLREPLSDSPR